MYKHFIIFIISVVFAIIAEYTLPIKYFGVFDLFSIHIYAWLAFFLIYLFCFLFLFLYSENDKKKDVQNFISDESRELNIDNQNRDNKIGTTLKLAINNKVIWFVFGLIIGALFIKYTDTSYHLIIKGGAIIKLNEKTGETWIYSGGEEDESAWMKVE